MCRKRLAELILTDPFRAYHVAMKCGWKDEARNAAVQLARLWIEEEYHPSMENLDAGLYYPLLKFCHEYRKILFSVRSSNSIPIPIDNASGSASFSQILSEYDRMWRHVGHQYVPDAASVLSLPGMPVLWANPLRSYSNSANLMQQLLCYQSIAEQLNNLQISWDDGHVFQHTVSRIVRKKGKKGKR
ncbi:hypothetical protein QCA50_019510 [Cerrena zonata]|uniref:Uncharacterized protein n=1 Tax=Cerrena zonata TaxID=2478898 RepID=A0AAW0FDP1_9APHY